MIESVRTTLKALHCKSVDFYKASMFLNHGCDELKTLISHIPEFLAEARTFAESWNIRIDLSKKHERFKKFFDEAVPITGSTIHQIFQNKSIQLITRHQD